MKFLKWNSLLSLILTMGLILGLGLMAGCGDDDPTDPGNILPTATITATLDGTGFDYSKNASATNMGEVDERIIGGGDQAANKVILITVPKAAASYTVNVGSDASIILTDGTTTWGCVSGTLVLSTSTDTNLVGTFIGTFEDVALNTMLVTNGAFDVPLVLVQ